MRRYSSTDKLPAAEPRGASPGSGVARASRRPSRDARDASLRLAASLPGPAGAREGKHLRGRRLGAAGPVHRGAERRRAARHAAAHRRARPPRHASTRTPTRGSSSWRGAWSEPVKRRRRDGGGRGAAQAARCAGPLRPAPLPCPPAAASRAAAARPISPAVSLSRAMANLDVEAQALSEREERDPRSVPSRPKSLSSLRFLEGALATLASAVDGADADPTPDARAGFARLESTLTRGARLVGSPEDRKSRGAELEAASGWRAAHRLQSAGYQVASGAGCRVGGELSDRYAVEGRRFSLLLRSDGSLPDDLVAAFRLIFGSSTYARAAVLAIFMGGLGVGSLLLGERADRKARPLEFTETWRVADCHLGGASSRCFDGRWIYVERAGSATLGWVAHRSCVSFSRVFVIGVPTFSSALRCRCCTGDRDGRRCEAASRRGLYCGDTLVAVAGALLLNLLDRRRIRRSQDLLMAARQSARWPRQGRRHQPALPHARRPAGQHRPAAHPVLPRLLRRRLPHRRARGIRDVQDALREGPARLRPVRAGVLG